MKSILFGLSLLACAAASTSAIAATDGGTHCISFSPAGFCDGMEYDGKKSATWHNYDCAGSQGKQTKANYKKGTTFCNGDKGCQPAQLNGWDSFSWSFDLKASTGTLTGITGGQEFTLQQDIPVGITKGACDFAQFNKSGVSSLAR
jgi:hypothetical protein